MSNLPRRMWINQPSKLQPLHELHGLNVLAVRDESGECARIYCLNGWVISQQAPWSSLSDGWRDKEK